MGYTHGAAPEASTLDACRSKSLLSDPCGIVCNTDKCVSVWNALTHSNGTNEPAENAAAKRHMQRSGDETKAEAKAKESKGKQMTLKTGKSESATSVVLKRRLSLRQLQ